MTYQWFTFHSFNSCTFWIPQVPRTSNSMLAIIMLPECCRNKIGGIRNIYILRKKQKNTAQCNSDSLVIPLKRTFIFKSPNTFGHDMLLVVWNNKLLLLLKGSVSVHMTYRIEQTVLIKNDVWMVKHTSVFCQNTSLCVVSTAMFTITPNVKTLDMRIRLCSEIRDHHFFIY